LPSGQPAVIGQCREKSFHCHNIGAFLRSISSRPVGYQARLHVFIPIVSIFQTLNAESSR
jgi:hypothetical protein